MMPMQGMERGRSPKIEVSQVEKIPKAWGQKGTSESLGSDAAKKSC